MAILAGEIPTAARLNRMQPVPYSATATAALTGPQTDGAITGATITLTTTTANAVAQVMADFDFAHTGATSSVSTGELYLAGAKQAGEATYQVASGTTNDRGTHGQGWLLTLGAAGSYTFDLRATLPTNVRVNQNNTRLIVVIYKII